MSAKKLNLDNRNLNFIAHFNMKLNKRIMKDGTKPVLFH